MQGSISSESKKNRFDEPAKFLPVMFIGGNIVMLWTIYMSYHCIPSLQQPQSASYGIPQTLAFNFVTAMMLVCYALCILTHPGTIPDKDPAWEYVPQDRRQRDEALKGMNQQQQETKRSGDRRHCKWCSKYKPDRCHHCRVCRTCILRMDHHCPWIYNCVGFANHKYFFLLLLYSAIACHIIMWTMSTTLKASIAPDTPFLTMFLLLLGETLAVFWGFMVSLFFCFHIWLMLKAMTTIEFCEKSMKKAAYDTHAYNRGLYGNIKAVLGDNPLLWLVPCSPPAGDGLNYSEELPLLSSSLTAGMPKQMPDSKPVRPKQIPRRAGTGECAGADELSEGSLSESSPA